MSEKMNAKVAKVSKYAAKKNVETNVVEETTTQAPIDETKAVDETVTSRKFNKRFNKFRQKNEKGLPVVTDRFPQHQVGIALLIKNNAEIRRFTALGVLNYLLQKGEISGDKRFVSFKWNKFAVKANGLMREYSYSEPFFLNALVASFSSFSASAQKVIDNFCNVELNSTISDSVNANEVATIVEANDKHKDDANCVIEDENENED